mmetsp:Transcript_11028/g.41070  ORF Transcript_11028/g.41070 Transcript_11028/m.41070 type:complete len:513 (-) Transcript_11028:1644-3182(-)|eukprot:CAMPEP_0117434606 /NCGR_PEP_ID=MMETSP0759-20121206/39_1 /TAXON_ID=63605 /ORGANISM="Percolomonas cosmopolitus, Strain WS" /LENGTH=512 /DNA_ID=CAMNT_0005226101 /DNA_START=84 /DNA_END=1622 /DNA_ORIENTATION=-
MSTHHVQTVKGGILGSREIAASANKEIPTKIMWAETERFKQHAQQLVDNISQNAKNIYKQYDSMGVNTHSRFKKLAEMGANVAQKFVMDKNDVYSRPNRQQEGTYLIQIKSKNILNSNAIFGDPHPNGCVPLVLVPRKRCLRLYCVIPEGVTAIPMRWGKILGTWEPGFHPMPLGTSVGFVVTKSHIPFEYPVRSCPTIDCVMVKIEVLIVFTIADALKFVLNLGPYKLTDLLSAFLEESIRSLGRSVFYDQVYDLRGKSMNAMIRSLRDKLLEPFGIDVDDITITNIQIPRDLQNSMQDETSYISKHRCKQKNHEYDISVLLNREQRHFAVLGNENERKVLDEESKRFRLLLSKECDELIALTQKRLAEIRSEEQSDSLKIRLDADKEVAVFDGKKYKVLMQLHAAAHKRAALIQTNAIAFSEMIRAQTEFDVATDHAAALKFLHEAEAKSFEDLRQLRSFMLRTKQLEVLEALAENPDLTISGSQNYSPLAQIRFPLSGSLMQNDMIKGQ